jgi:hypothetical protein
VEEMRNAQKLLFGKSEWKRTVGSSSCRSEDKIKMRLEELRLGDVG